MAVAFPQFTQRLAQPSAAHLPRSVFHGGVGRVELREAEPRASVVGANGLAVLVVGGAVLGAGVAVVAVLVLRGALREEVAGVGDGAARPVVREVAAVGVRLAQ